MKQLTTTLAGTLLMLTCLSTGACRRTDQSLPQPAQAQDPAPPTASAAARPEVVGNATCPVSGKPVGGSSAAPSFYSDFRGMRIGFMCPNCKGTFDRSPANRKLELLNKALTSAGRDPLNE